ncbi:carboxypeptidase-like regulatory domain-containing protein [Actinoplanes sp. CA-252034]|uniref:carboxypeptidase-like regulatory domain-containing protein n=1 Tax=Actinoplanes sp. CA-252034 TaxID=3239906 RepID=UPI003D966318
MTIFLRLSSAAAAGVVALSLAAATPVHAETATGAISGTLTSADGIPMADVGVSVHTLGGPGAGEPTRTDDEGRYSIADLPPGTYRVQFWVERDTNSSWHQWAHQATQAARASRFTVAAGQEVTVDETRFRTGSLALTLRDADGQSISAFCADASGDNFVETGCTETGTLILDGLPADDYVVWAWSDSSSAVDMTTTVADQVNELTLTAF